MLLLLFNRLKEGFDVASTEATKVMTLNELKEDRRSILYGASEYLVEMTRMIVVHENVVLMKERYFLADVNLISLQTLLKLLIVSVRCLQKLNT